MTKQYNIQRKASLSSFLSHSIGLMIWCALGASADADGIPLSGELPPTVSKGEKPYLVTETVVVAEGNQTIIEKGVVFLFKNFTGIDVKGTLRVEGTVNQPVIFTSENDTIYNPSAPLEPAAFDWDGITVHPGEAENIFEHCCIHYSLFGIKSLTPNIVITDCVFKDNGNADVTIEGEKLMVTSPFRYTPQSQSVAPSVATAEPSDEILPQEEVKTEPPLVLAPEKKDKKREKPPASVVIEPKKRGRAGMALFRLAGLTACCVGGAFGVREHLGYIDAREDFDALNDFDDDDRLHHTSEEWEAEKNHVNGHLQNALLFYGAGLVGFLSFTISFAF